MGKIQEIIDSRQCPGITGTRDNFGIKKEFYDVKTGQYINNYKTWEKAGFKSTSDLKPGRMKKMIKAKEKKLKYRGDRALDPRNLPM